ncbi:F0F1 ATP synthase subunit B [Streptomyces sp. A7024]|uniref:ATP synthase subunit b n=1 Tax=Streptomyces coryli TaxID=1128680 RepID=A0A6G4U6C4_9ACTN|nr:F0F1 ATP synthase subunit B [Streptomyces coryli]NGN66847.1 F0F1 ATP synthase subunit B [Streptomyces coryli]
MTIAALWVGPESFGPLRIEVWSLLVGGLCFAVFALLIGKWLLPRINEVLEKREAATTGRFEHAEALQVEADEVRAQYEAVLADARHEANRIRQEATEEGTALITAARSEATAERDAMVAEAHTQIAAEREAAEAALRPNVNLLAEELAGRILGEPVSAQAKRS